MRVIIIALIAMILSLLIPMYEAWEDDDIWQKCWHLPVSAPRHQS